MKNWRTRPTTDYAKEALFNILENDLDLEDLIAIDLFAGTGSITFELISRGCKKVTAVDKFGKAVQFIDKQAEEWGISDKLTTIRKDVRAFLKAVEQGSAELIFADPPYDLKWIEQLPEMIYSSSISQQVKLLVIEHDQRVDYSSFPKFRELRKYGQSRFSFFA